MLGEWLLWSGLQQIDTELALCRQLLDPPQKARRPLAKSGVGARLAQHVDGADAAAATAAGEARDEEADGDGAEPSPPGERCSRGGTADSRSPDPRGLALRTVHGVLHRHDE